MTIKRCQIAGITFTFRRAGAPHYAHSWTLEKLTGENRIIKQQTEGSDTNETRYSLMKGDNEMAFIRGYLDGPTKFHIQRIENASEDKISGFKYLPQIYAAMERDLRLKGVEKVTTLSLAKLAHIAVKRYGFYDTGGKSYEELKNSWSKKIPWKAVSLEKRL